jgi:5'-3' exoribonuclease 1
MTISQRMIFDQVKAFVLENRSSSSSDAKKALLTMPNMFSAGDKAFINKLADDLHLTITWDEYDEQDQNLLIWRFPGSLEEPLLAANGTDGDDGEGSDEWTDEDEEEGREAVDRVLKKYETARVAMENAEDNFDMREEQRLKEKMDEWKRSYYQVCLTLLYDDERN